LFTVGLHTDYTSLGKTVALKDDELRLESFVGERNPTALGGAKTGEIEFPDLGTSIETAMGGTTERLLIL